MKMSITIVGKPVDYVYLIKEINMDKMTLEKYNTDCREHIESSWVRESSTDDKIIEIKLTDKISSVTLTARAPIIEMAAKLGGKIIKDIKTERMKKGKKTFICGIELFKEQIS